MPVFTWAEIAGVLGGVNLAVVIRVAFQTGRVVQKIEDMDRRLTAVEGRH